MKIFSFCLIFGVLFGLVMTAKPRRSAKRTVRGLKTSKQNGEFDGLSADTVALIKELRKMMNKCHGRDFCWLDFSFPDIIVRFQIQSLLSVNYSTTLKPISRLTIKLKKDMIMEIFHDFNIEKPPVSMSTPQFSKNSVSTSTPAINVPKSFSVQTKRNFWKSGPAKFFLFQTRWTYRQYTMWHSLCLYLVLTGA